jgi:hypothetical protein
MKNTLIIILFLSLFVVSWQSNNPQNEVVTSNMVWTNTKSNNLIFCVWTGTEAKEVSSLNEVIQIMNGRGFRFVSGYYVTTNGYTIGQQHVLVFEKK